MGELFFTSDLHFGHANIIKYCERPFKDVYHMNEELIKKWNERVKPNDMVYVLGDFYFSKSKKGNGLQHPFDYYDDRLNGNKVFVLGNHESSNKINSKIKGILVEFGGKEIWCCHRPEDSNNFYPLNFVGHVHKKWVWKIDKKFGYDSFLINVGTDVWNYAPVKATELFRLYELNGVVK